MNIIKTASRTKSMLYCLASILALGVVFLFAGADFSAEAKVQGGELKMRQITTGNDHTCAIASDNWVYCWGDGGDGQIGNGSTSNQSTPVAVSQGEMPTDATIRQLAAGNDYNCAVASNNKAYCWGEGTSGRLGNGSTSGQSTPVAVSQGEMPAGATIRQLAVGREHACAIASDNKAYCWGNGDDGQLGNDSTSNQPTPVAISQGEMPAGVTIRQIAAGSDHTCAIASDNKAYCWGDGTDGQLGNGSSAADYDTPVAVLRGSMPADATIRYMTAGSDFTCAIASDSKAYCWGWGINGHLGNGSTSSQSAPVAVLQGDMPAGATVQQISSGPRHTCAIASDHKAYCWGWGSGGRLGYGSNSDRGYPAAIAQGEMPSGVTIQQTAPGGTHTCVIASDHRAYCWGDSTDGNIGNGLTGEYYPTALAVSAVRRQVPVSQSVYRTYGASSSVLPGSPLAGDSAPGTLTAIADEFRLRIGLTNLEGGVSSMVAGGEHSCAVDSSGWAYCWGYGSSGRLGTGVDVATEPTPTAIVHGDMPTAATLEQLTIGYTHTCVLASDSKPYCWGGNSHGQIGDGTYSSRNSPTAVSQGVMPDSTARQVVTGSHHVCVVASDDKAYCWGQGHNGRLGNDNPVNQTTPVAVLQGEMPAGATIQAIAADQHTCAIASDNWAYCWGAGNAGKLGNGLAVDQYTPVAVSQGEIPAGATIRQVAVGNNHACAVASDNKAYCWGGGGAGQLGNGSTVDQYTPVAVSQGEIPAGATIRQISVRHNHTCVVASDSKAYCWGEGERDRLGNGNNINQSTPVAVLQGEMPAGATIQHVSAGAWHSCAVASDGKVYCWGWGDSNRLGNGSTATQAAPVAVLEGQMARDVALQRVSTGGTHTCAVASNYQAYCWGEGDDGHLGNGATSSQATPVAVLKGEIPADVAFEQIANGNDHTCAIASNQKAYCWGEGADGHIGNGATGDHSTPVAVAQGETPPGATFRQIAAGNDYTCAIASDGWVYCWGDGADGRLGYGSTSDRSSPVAISQGEIPVGVTAESISAYNNHTCIVGSDGKAYCWGLGTQGRLGNNSTATSNTPVAVHQGDMPSGATIRQIAAMGSHTCAVASDNKLYCWGWGTTGALGDGQTGNRLEPAIVSQGDMPAGSTVLQVTGGNAHTCAIASDHKAYCWGNNANGQLGDSTTDSRVVPAAVSQGSMPPGVAVQQIAAGNEYTCAVASNHKVYCWGWGSSGRLGTGSTSNQTAPATVLEGEMEDLTGIIGTGALDLSLEVAPLGAAATCDLVTTGWQAVSASSAMAWGTAPPSHGTSISAFGSDPTAPTLGGYAYQAVVQSGSFTNTEAIAPQQTGLWDVVLYDRSSRSATDYCFRIVSNRDATSIDEYAVYPHVTTATGSLATQFVDSNGAPLLGSEAGAVFQPVTASPNPHMTYAHWLSEGVYNRLLEVHNSLSDSGWSVSLAASDGPSARWESASDSYAYNDEVSYIESAVEGEGVLQVMSSPMPMVKPQASATPYGTDPTGAPCTLAGVSVIAEDIYFDSWTSAVTLLTGNPSSQFNCSWRLQDVLLAQIIPPAQSPGSYSLDMTVTIVAN